MACRIELSVVGESNFENYRTVGVGFWLTVKQFRLTSGQPGSTVCPIQNLFFFTQRWVNSVQTVKLLGTLRLSISEKRWES